MDKELTFHPETERTRDLVYSEFSSCDRSIHLLVQESPGVPYDVLLKAYREAVSAYLSSVELLPPVDFLKRLVWRFEEVCAENRLSAEHRKKLSIHLVLRTVDAAYVLTTRENDVRVCVRGEMYPVMDQALVEVERIGVEPSEIQAELFPEKLVDFIAIFRLAAARLDGVDLVLGCVDADAGAVLEGLSQPAWLKTPAQGDVRATRHSMVSKFVSRRVLVVRFGGSPGVRERSEVRPTGRRRLASAMPSGRRLVLPLTAVIVAILIVVLWRREGPGPERLTSAQVSHPEVSVQHTESPTTRSDGVAEGVDGDAQGIRLTEAWRGRYEKEVTSSPVLFEASVIFGCRDGGVYALDRRTGRQLWKYAATAGVGSSPVLWGDRVIVADYNGNVFGLDARTGERIWTRKLAMRVVSSPAVSGDRVVVGCYDGSAYCLSAEDGSKLWSVKTGARIRGSVEASGESFFVPSYDGFLYALSSESGKVMWRVRVGGTVSASPAVGDGVVVIGGTDGKVRAVDAASGGDRWVSATAAAVESRIATSEGRALLGSNDGKLYCFDLKDGSTVWTFNTGKSVLGRPFVRDGVVYAGSYDGNVYAVDLSSGDAIDTFKTGAPVYSSPVADEDRVYFGTNRGEFICLDLRGDETS